MKIVFSKQAKNMANDLTKELKILLLRHGLKVKESSLMQFNYKCYISLGGKKDKYNKY